MGLRLVGPVAGFELRQDLLGLALGLGVRGGRIPTSRPAVHQHTIRARVRMSVRDKVMSTHTSMQGRVVRHAV